MSENIKTLNDMENAMENNPYATLIEKVGRSFNATDKLLMDIRRDELIHDDERCEFAVLHHLQRNEAEGNTRMNANTMVSKKYNPRELSFKEKYPYFMKMIKAVCVNSDRLYYDDETKTIAIMSTYVAECEIALWCRTMVKKSKSLDMKREWSEFLNLGDFTLTDKQGVLLKNAIEYNLSCLVGYSGSGKSASAKGLINMLEANEKTYLLLAPTGKA